MALFIAIGCFLILYIWDRVDWAWRTGGQAARVKIGIGACVVVVLLMIFLAL